MIKNYVLILVLSSFRFIYGQTLLDETGDAYVRNSSSTSSWNGTTNFTLRATAAQTTGFRLSYEADSDPRVGRLTLNNNYGGIYGDFAISLRTGSGIFERFRISSSGNVGIGTTNSQYKLDVNGTGRFSDNLTIDDSKYIYMGSTNDRIKAENGSIGIYPNQHFYVGAVIGGVETRNVTFLENGNVGIGTENPAEKLHVSGTTSITGDIGTANDAIWKTGQHTLELQNGDAGDVVLAFHRSGYSSSSIRHTSIGGLTLSGNGAYNSTHLHINDSGQVGIGTTSMGTHELAVEGTIGTREIKVEANSWPDFAFKNNYTLPTLEEVEEHIYEKGHLPEIPSEAEVTQNGINLGEMDAKLLQKIEELTLYMIDINKEVKQLKFENQALKEKVKSLKNK